MEKVDSLNTAKTGMLGTSDGIAKLVSFRVINYKKHLAEDIKRTTEHTIQNESPCLRFKFVQNVVLQLLNISTTTRSLSGIQFKSIKVSSRQPSSTVFNFSDRSFTITRFRGDFYKCVYVYKLPWPSFTPKYGFRHFAFWQP